MQPGVRSSRTVQAVNTPAVRSRSRPHLESEASERNVTGGVFGVGSCQQRASGVTGVAYVNTNVTAEGSKQKRREGFWRC